MTKLDVTEPAATFESGYSSNVRLVEVNLTTVLDMIQITIAAVAPSFAWSTHEFFLLDAVFVF